MKKTTINEAALRALLLPWGGVEVGTKWHDELVFTVCEKMFCVLSSGGNGAGSLSFKVETERFLEMTDRPGVRPAPYLARARWVTLDDPSVLPIDELEELLETSYSLVVARLTRRQRAELAK